VLLVGLSAVPLYLTAKHIFKSPFVPSLIAVIYLFFRHLVIGLMQDFHFEMLFPLFFFSCYYFIAVKKEPALYFLFMTLTLFIREDIPIYLFFWGLFLIFKRKEKKIGILTSALSLSYFCLAIFVVIPYFRSQAGLTTPYVYQHVWGHLGKNNLQILWSLLMHPWLIFQGVPIAVVLRKLLDIVLPLGLLPLFSSYGSLIGPPLLVAILSRIPQNYMFGLHYSATVLPFVFLGFIYGLKGIAGRLERKSAVSGKRIFLAVVILITAVNLMNSNLWRWTSPARYRAVKDYRSVQRLISQIPPDASVAALSSLIPHIPRRKAIFMLPETGGAEYILIHSGINLWPYTKEEYDRVLKKIESEKNYYCLARLGDAKLFKKNPQ
jgi:uncharacterized membrane protein